MSQYLNLIFEVYWSQIILIFGAVWSLILYFFKRRYDLKSKKLEINHTIFQESRIKAVNHFFENYALAESMWYNMAIHEILKGNVTSKEMDQMVAPKLQSLKGSSLALGIFFERELYQLFQTVTANMYAINRELMMLFGIVALEGFHSKSQSEINELVIQFDTDKWKILNENTSLLADVSKKVTRLFEA